MQLRWKALGVVTFVLIFAGQAAGQWSPGSSAPVGSGLRGGPPPGASAPPQSWTGASPAPYTPSPAPGYAPAYARHPALAGSGVPYSPPAAAAPQLQTTPLAGPTLPVRSLNAGYGALGGGAGASVPANRVTGEWPAEGPASGYVAAPGYVPAAGYVPTPESCAVEMPAGAATRSWPAGSVLGNQTARPLQTRSPWYFKSQALIMTRDNENEVWFSYDTADIASQILGSLDAHMGWRYGNDLRIGRYFDQGRGSVETAFWGLWSQVQEANALGAAMVGGLDTSLRFDSLVYDPGTGNAPVSSFFFNAERHRLRRSHEAYNLELNVWRHCTWGCGGCGGGGACGPPRARLSWMAGVRYFKFDEGFEFASDTTNTAFGDNPDSELFYRVDAANHLIGFQIGGQGEFCFWNRWQLMTVAKMGVFGNHIQHESYIGSVNRAATVSLGGSPFDTQAFDVQSSKNDVALLGEIELGLRYQVNDGLNLTAGYRAVGVTGLALATNQTPYYFANLGGVGSIDSNGSLILHGVMYLGGEYNY